MSINTHDLLLDRCDKCSAYPLNLLRKGHLKRQLKKHRDYLDDNEDDIFEPDDECLEFLELCDGNHRTLDSRSPLNCSRESFVYALTFHQVSPFFLDYVYSFGDTVTPLDYSMIGFQSEDSLAVADDQVLEISKLGRSGRELRLCYLLRSAEKSQIDTSGRWPWAIRQMTVYHSFDLVTGRSLWLTIKANSLMRDAITEASAELPALSPRSLEDTAGSFAATLATHLVFLGWCDENWRYCINDAEYALRTILTKVKTANVDRDETGAHIDALTRAITIQKNAKLRTSEATDIPPRKKRPDRNIRRALNWMTIWKRSGNSLPVATFEEESPKYRFNRSARSRRYGDQLDSLEMFSFEELQTLHHIGEQIREMRLVIQLNMQALRDIKETYEGLVQRDELDSIQREERGLDQKQVAEFSRKVDGITRSLEVRLTQLDTMIAWLNDGKGLFDDILQFRSVQASRVFAEIAHEQGKKMENIANKTENQTGSMHIITFVTLAFLPGTFVATFFQSGLVSWPDSDQNGGSGGQAEVNTQGLGLFFAITIPMMFITGILWWLVYRYLKRRRRMKAMEVDLSVI
ncbi:hypothetical protein B0T10DRAFT_418216 [Thelonectria olida]|uniref:CorA-like transporter domain-containing protein n=1 Tax=Thelonectria olida TaxID=1576542 RepID=A0A9P8VQK8_9HYPO|nr:hypothetical protein B0T10DRAFT_418216 [Thelonectria olida]